MIAIFISNLSSIRSFEIANLSTVEVTHSIKEGITVVDPTNPPMDFLKTSRFWEYIVHTDTQSTGKSHIRFFIYHTGLVEMK